MESDLPRALPRRPAELPTDEVLSLLNAHGTLVLDAIESPARIDRVAHELQPWLDLPPQSGPLGTSDFGGHETLRISGLIAKSPAYRELVMHPSILAIVDSVLAPMCSRIQLSVTQAIKICPGERHQPLHRDDVLYPLPCPGPVVSVTVIWPLCDFTAANGATRVYPGSHRWPRGRVPQPNDPSVCAEMRPGDALLYLGSCFHGGGANTTAQPRTGVLANYVVGWLRQEENQYLACPPELAHTLPIELQQLLGYAEHYPLLGWYEGANPSILRTGPIRKEYGAELRGTPALTMSGIIQAGSRATAKPRSE